VYSEEIGDRQVFIPIGSFKGNTVAMKKITAPINLQRPLMVELKAMKDIQHEHLVKFYGAIIDKEPCLLTEYCSKGSLQGEQMLAKSIDENIHSKYLQIFWRTTR
jgi:atrial natriuretic peptide receptor A